MAYDFPGSSTLSRTVTRRAVIGGVCALQLALLWRAWRGQGDNGQLVEYTGPFEGKRQKLVPLVSGDAEIVNIAKTLAYDLRVQTKLVLTLGPVRGEEHAVQHERIVVDSAAFDSGNDMLQLQQLSFAFAGRAKFENDGPGGRQHLPITTLPVCFDIPAPRIARIECVFKRIGQRMPVA